MIAFLLIPALVVAMTMGLVVLGLMYEQRRKP